MIPPMILVKSRSDQVAREAASFRKRSRDSWALSAASTVEKSFRTSLIAPEKFRRLIDPITHRL